MSNRDVLWPHHPRGWEGENKRESGRIKESEREERERDQNTSSIQILLASHFGKWGAVLEFEID